MGWLNSLCELWRESEPSGCWGWDVTEVTSWLEASGKCIGSVDVVALVASTETEVLGSAW